MAKKESDFPVGVVSAVIILGSVAAVFLINNFGQMGFADSWPVLPMAVGLCLAAASYVELGLAVMGFFLLILLANMAVVPPFGKSWPFALIWIALLVVVGYMRSRAAAKKTHPDRAP
jgi:hypothetical protein